MNAAIGDWQRRDWSHATYYGAWPSLRRVLSHLVLSGAPDLTPLVPRVAAPAARQTYFTPDALAALLDAPCPAWLRCLVLLCHDCGLRARTALNLRLSQYNAATGNISTRTKQGRGVSVPVSNRLARVLAIVPGDDAPIVAALAGAPAVSYPAARRHFIALCADAGLPHGYTLHDLRRTVARELYQASGSLDQVQHLLGHMSARTTLGYLASEVLSVDRDALAAVTGEKVNA